MKKSITLSIISGVLLGISYPPFQLGFLAYFSLVPLLVALDDLKTHYQVFKCSTIAFFIFSVITLYWVGAFNIAKDRYLLVTGIALFVVTPVWFYLAVRMFFFVRKGFGKTISMIAFPFIWVGWEYMLTKIEIGFPWLTIGHTQSYDLTAIQFASYTGVFGVSFWIIILNVLLFYLIQMIISKKFGFLYAKAIVLIILIVSLIILPRIYGSMIFNDTLKPSNSDVEKIKIGVIQPNINPYEKWYGNVDKQIGVLQSLSSSAAKENVDLLLWPETAVPLYLLFPTNYTYFNKIKDQVDSINIHLLTGMTDWALYPDSIIPPRSSKHIENGQRYDIFNSAILLEPHNVKYQKYDKMILVPFAERIPWVEELSFLNLDVLRWNFGTSGYGIGRDTTVFSFCPKNMTDVKFSIMICFESVFPEFVSRFVQKGSQFLVVITNDNWWGKTSGPYQHLQFDIFRAIENRRWLVRCNNGGVSSIIDQYGNMRQSTEIGVATTLTGFLELNDEKTFYTLHGDYVGKWSSYIAALILIAAMINKLRIRLFG
ncbi:MAG: apolipoprotein N-acyltransferase [Ignavibacteriales bacterium]|nr:apolipoprotein N-acyltransferase [Ignavibacteriales bacterium]